MLMKELTEIKLASWIKFVLYAILVLSIYHLTLIRLVTKDWAREGYSYCYLIPFVVLYLIWIKKDQLVILPSIRSWTGLVPLFLGLLFFWIGELSGVYFALYLSFWLVIVGLLWLHFGWKKLKSIGFALFFMLTIFPIYPDLNIQLMLKLRLISSKLGVSMIQLYGLPVRREGNIIDLGFTQLQVVEACSGLNSLISLVVLTLLLVYFFKAHIWKRCVVVLSAIPLAIFTNSLRIAVTAILYRYFGPEVAEGFFHGFSGLLIFLLCIPLLLLEIKILAKLPPVERKSSSNTTDSENRPSISNPDPKEKKILQSATLRQPIFIVAVILLGATLALSQGVEFREKIPVNKSVVHFPLEVGEWKANSREKIAQKFLDALDLSEYVMLDYKNRAGKSVNFYVAYYERQSKGKSIHSPAVCIPGSGWSFDQSGTVSISAMPGNPDKIQISRAVIQYGRSTQIAYYWFSQRGRILNNVYQLRIYNFWDALTMQRTDGALVRLITPVYENEQLADADARLQSFVRDIVPVLEEYIPGKDLAHSS
jgi:exosortase D (VPLPA-CTERM-specific)